MRACGKVSFNLIDLVSQLRVANQISGRWLYPISDIYYMGYSRIAGIISG